MVNAAKRVDEEASTSYGHLRARVTHLGPRFSNLPAARHETERVRILTDAERAELSGLPPHMLKRNYRFNTAEITSDRTRQRT